MKIPKNVLYYLEELKIPLEPSYGPEDWKDWFHYVFFSPDHAMRLLVNISISGKKGNGIIAATCSLTIGNSTTPQTFAFMKTTAWEQQTMERMPVKIVVDDFIHLDINEFCSQIKIDNPRQAFSIDVKTEPLATPVLINELFPYGDGFIGWGFMPGMTSEGQFTSNENTYSINQNWFCYHDRNYGRFRWGDKSVGWIWWVARLNTTEGDEFAFVFHLGTNKDHSVTGSGYLFVYHNHVMVKTFMGAMVNLEIEWTDAPSKNPVLPGSMATLFSACKTKIPKKLIIDAKDDSDFVSIHLNSEAETEIIIPDYQYKQYTFLKEINGNAEAHLSVGMVKNKNAKGCFFAEYVH